MAVNKNFVVKNGLEVNTDLLFADSATRAVGVGSTSPNFDLDVRGGIGATDLRVTGFTTLTKDFQVGASGSAFYVSNTNNLVGVGTSVPAFLMDIRSSVSTGQTALYVKGDMRVTGDINLDDLTIDDLTVTGIATYKPDGSGGSPDSWIDIDYTGNTTTGGGTTVGFGSTAYFVDNAKVVFGAGEDLSIYHNASNSIIDNTTGDLYLKTSGSGDDVYIESVDDIYLNAASKSAIHVFGDGAVDLYHNDTRRFATTHGGVVVAGGSSITGISTVQSTAQNQINATTGALQVAGGAGIAKNLYVGGGAEITGVATVTGVLDANDTTQSSSSTTGAAKFAGGVGVAKNLFVGGGAEVTGVTTITGTLDANGALDVDGHTELDDVNVAGAATFAGAIDANSTSDFNGVVTVSNTTQSSSKDTGAIIVEGGAGIEKNLFVGGGAEVTGVTTITGTLDANGALDVDGHTELDDVNVAGASTFAGAIDANATTQSSASTNGAATFAGGVGVAKNLFAGGGVKVGAAFTIGTGIGVTTILDDDAFNNASATALASQQSIKAYVDTQITAEDLDFAGDNGTGAVDLDSQSLTIAGTASQVETTASSQTLTVKLADNVIVSNACTVSATTQSSSKDTGSLVLQGGAGIEKNLFVGGGAEIAGISTFDSNVYLQKADAANLYVGSTNAGGAAIFLDGDSNGDWSGSDYSLIRHDSDGNLVITANSPGDAHCYIKLGASGHYGAMFKEGAESLLRYNNTTRIQTGPAGVIVTGIATADGFALGDNEKITFGASEDFKIEHNSNENYIDSNSGHIYIRANVNDDEGDNIYLQPKSGENGIIVTHDGSVELYHDDQKTCETFANGIVVRSGGEGNDGEIQLYADQGDDNADLWRLKADTSGVFGVDSYGTGSWVNKLQVNPSGAIVSGILTAVGGFNIGIQSGHTLINTGVGNSIGIVTAINFVGSGNTVVYNSSTKTVDIAISGGGGAGGISTTYQNISSTSATGIATFSATEFRAASIVLSVTQGTSYQAGRYMVIHDGTTPTVVEESAVATGSMIASFDATIGSGNLTFRATMGSSGIATVGIKVDTLKSDAIP